MAKFGVFGDSYVERMRRDCGGTVMVHGMTRFFGKGGLRTDRMDENLLARVINAHVNVLVVNIGGNDITPTASPSDIFQRICDLIETFEKSGVSVVYVNEIMTRGDFSKCPGLTKAVFDRRRKTINKLLHEKFSDRFVKFTDIKFPADYLPDLVHLQTDQAESRNCGMRKFECRISRIFRSWQ